MTGIGDEIISSVEDLIGGDFVEDLEQDPETGVYNLEVEPGHYLFWPCKCDHVFGRHNGTIGNPKTGPCFDCNCRSFSPREKFQAWRNTQK